MGNDFSTIHSGVVNKPPEPADSTFEFEFTGHGHEGSLVFSKSDLEKGFGHCMNKIHIRMNRIYGVERRKEYELTYFYNNTKYELKNLQDLYNLKTIEQPQLQFKVKGKKKKNVLNNRVFFYC